MNFKRRVGRLEKEMYVSTEITTSRVTICGVVGEVDRAKSTCRRTLSNGQLHEVIYLAGSPKTMADGELEQFIESFPILDPEGRAVTLPDSARVIRK